MGTVTSVDMHFDSVKVFGDVDLTAKTGVTNIYLNRCYFDHAFNTSGANIVIAESCEFDELVDVGSYSRIVDCEFSGGMTVTSVQNYLPPQGIYNTDFSGTFTGPAGSCLLDAVSNYWFKNNGAVLAGGATKVILGDLTP